MPTSMPRRSVRDDFCDARFAFSCNHVDLLVDEAGCDSLCGMLSLPARRIPSASHQENRSQEGRQYILSASTNQHAGR
eukprot:228750-Prorocentrum_minimum.AAC.2